MNIKLRNIMIEIKLIDKKYESLVGECSKRHESIAGEK